MNEKIIFTAAIIVTWLLAVTSSVAWMKAQNERARMCKPYSTNDILVVIGENALIAALGTFLIWWMF